MSYCEKFDGFADPYIYFKEEVDDRYIINPYAAGQYILDHRAMDMYRKPIDACAVVPTLGDILRESAEVLPAEPPKKKVDFFESDGDDDTEIHPHIVQANDVFESAMRNLHLVARQDPALRDQLATVGAMSHSLPLVRGADGKIRQMTVAQTNANNTHIALDAISAGGDFKPNEGFDLVRDSQANCVLWAANPKLDVPIADSATPDLLREADDQFDSYFRQLGSSSDNVVSYNMSLPELSAQLRRESAPRPKYQPSALVKAALWLGLVEHGMNGGCGYDVNDPEAEFFLID